MSDWSTSCEIIETKGADKNLNLKNLNVKKKEIGKKRK
jgi:hypothetical protein